MISSYLLGACTTSLLCSSLLCLSPTTKLCKSGPALSLPVVVPRDVIVYEAGPDLHRFSSRLSCSTLAQTPSPQVPTGTLQPKRPELLPLPETLPSPTPKPPLTAPQPVPPQPGSLPEATVKVRRVEVLGSTVFSPTELEAVVAPFIGKKLTFEQLLGIRTAITDSYTSKGYTTSGAFLPPQDISGGVIQVQVVEGQLEKIEIQGLRHLNKSYVRSRIHLATRTPLNIRSLEEALQLLQLDSLFTRVQAELQTGTALGRSVLVLNLKEAPQLSSSLVFENREPPSVGEIGGTAFLINNDLLGLGDRLSATVEKTEGVLAYGFSYDIPVNAHNGTVSFRYSKDENTVIEEPFAPLDITGRTQTYALSFRQPITRTSTNEFALGFSFDWRQSRTYLFGERPFSFVQGPEKGESKVTAIRFSQDWVNRSPNRVLAARSQFSVGLSVLGATVNDTGTDGRFFSWLGQFQWVQALNDKKDTLFVARAAAQLTPDSLLPLEQFAIGGIDTVRGYRENQQVGDNGIVGSLEVRLPLVNKPDGIGLIQLTPFFDIGTAWNNRGRNPDPSTIAGLGVGLNWAIASNFNVRLDYGIPLIGVDNRGNSLQDNGLYFSVRYQPF